MRHSEKLWAIVLAVIVAFVGYVAVSIANAHQQRDDAALYKWRLEWASRK